MISVKESSPFRDQACHSVAQRAGTHHRAHQVHHQHPPLSGLSLEAARRPAPGRSCGLAVPTPEPKLSRLYTLNGLRALNGVAKRQPLGCGDARREQRLRAARCHLHLLFSRFRRLRRRLYRLWNGAQSVCKKTCMCDFFKVCGFEL